jgi:hypothetical protein
MFAAPELQLYGILASRERVTDGSLVLTGFHDA